MELDELADPTTRHYKPDDTEHAPVHLGKKQRVDDSDGETLPDSDDGDEHPLTGEDVSIHSSPACVPHPFDGECYVPSPLPLSPLPPNAPILRLPDELLVHFIFTFLDDPSLCNALLVCRRWRDVGRTDYLWSGKTATKWGDKVKEKKRPEDSWYDFYRSWYVKQAFRGKIICCTGIAGEERETLKKIVEALGGEYSGVLNKTVTHLVAAKVTTDKHRVAARYGKTIIVNPKWVQACWETERLLDPTDYRLKPLTGCVISVTQFPPEVRPNIGNAIVEHGGEFTPDLRRRRNTHLLAVFPIGEKYIHALHWNLPVVTCKWLVDSMRGGYLMDETRYAV